MLRRRAIRLAALGALVIVSAKPAMSSGLHEDFGRFFSFLVAPQLYALDACFTRTDAPDNEALIISFSGRIPYRNTLVVQPELSYVSMTRGIETLNTAGDLRVRVRVKLWSSGGAWVYFIPAVRTGTGSADAFPYSTATIDVEAGLAVVDTVTAVAWWASASAVYPSRLDPILRDNHLYGNYANASVGALLPATTRLILMAALAAVMPRHQPAREVYFINGEFAYSLATTFYVSLHAEGGHRDNRAVDFTLGAGVRLTF